MTEDYVLSNLRTAHDKDPPPVPAMLPADASELEHLRELRDFLALALHWFEDDETPGRLKFYIQLRDAFVKKYKTLPAHALGWVQGVIDEHAPDQFKNGHRMSRAERAAVNMSLVACNSLGEP